MINSIVTSLNVVWMQAEVHSPLRRFPDAGRPSSPKRRSDDMHIKVECYAGYRGEETPRRFRIGGHDQNVAEIIDRWLAPDHRYFKFKTDDHSIWIIRHDTLRQSWELVSFQQG